MRALLAAAISFGVVISGFAIADAVSSKAQAGNQGVTCKQLPSQKKCKK
jgi:hypothetical protein